MTKRSRPKERPNKTATASYDQGPINQECDHFIAYTEPDDEQKRNSAVYKDLNLQIQQGVASKRQKDQYDLAMKLPGYRVTNPIDDLVPGKKHVSVLYKLREPHGNLDCFHIIMDKVKAMPSNYVSALKVNVQQQFPNCEV